MSVRQDISDAFCSCLVVDPDDLPAFEFAMCLVVAQHVPAVHQLNDQFLWGYLIGPPSSLKTQILKSINNWPNYVYQTSRLSPKALVSGYEPKDGSDPSLLHRLNGKVLVIKDFTSQLGQNKDDIRQVMGDLRSAYDGDFQGDYGSVGQRGGRADFGVIAATTPSIDEVLAQSQQLGERFLACRLARGRARRFSMADERAVLEEAARRKAGSKWQALQQGKTLQALEGLITGWQSTPGALPAFEGPTAEVIRTLTPLLVRARTEPSELAGLMDSEGPYRLCQQLTKLATARAVLDGRSEFTDDDSRFVVRIAHDTLNPILNRVLYELYRVKDWYPAGKLSGALRLPAPMRLKARLEQLVYVGLVEESKSSGSAATRFTLSPMAREFLDFTNYFEQGSIYEGPSEQTQEKKVSSPVVGAA